MTNIYPSNKPDYVLKQYSTLYIMIASKFYCTPYTILFNQSINHSIKNKTVKRQD
jgi:hypothetical protein